MRYISIWVRLFTLMLFTFFMIYGIECGVRYIRKDREYSKYEHAARNIKIDYNVHLIVFSCDQVIMNFIPFSLANYDHKSCL